MDLRTTPERKAFYERAAATRGQSLTAFAEQVLDEAAESAIAQAERIELSAPDGRFLLELLLGPVPEPSPALRNAAVDLQASGDDAG